MLNRFLTNYTETTFIEKIKDNLRRCKSFSFSVSFIKKLALRDAIINDLVVPFKYYGIRDQLIDYGLSKSEERKMIAQLANDEHIEFISAQIESHRTDGKLKTLAFCRNVTHARMMCEATSNSF